MGVGRGRGVMHQYYFYREHSTYLTQDEVAYSSSQNNQGNVASFHVSVILQFIGHIPHVSTRYKYIFLSSVKFIRLVA